MAKFKGKGKKKGVRLTGLFRTKRKGLYVGKVRADEELSALKKLIKKAEAEGSDLTMFVWKNKDEDGPAFTLVADIAQDAEGGKRRKRRDEDDEDEDQDEEDDEDGEDDEDPFADD